MQIDRPLALLGGLTPAAFMRRHWQKRPLLVRGAVPPGTAQIDRAALFALAARDDVESRLVVRQGGRWRVRHGPLARRALPALSRPGWTLLVQGVDLHVPAAHELLSRFRFVPDARLDDLMVSYASEEGGVGPHLDSYDVFLLQAQGRRRWRVAPPGPVRWRDDVPLKMLAGFEPVHDWLLEPGDLLYLPPGWGHEGVAVGSDCMTCSIGFRAPARTALAHELLLRLADAVDVEGADDALYRDAAQPATATPALVPKALQAFAQRALARALADRDGLARALGEVSSEPKPQVWFAPGDRPHAPGDGIRCDRRTRMLYDARHLYVNGESFRIGGRDGTLLRRLADERRLAPGALAKLTPAARAIIDAWLADGWLEPEQCA